MKNYSSTAQAQSDLSSGSVLAIGIFDGVHYGHQQIIEQVLAKAKELKAQAGILTFQPHPVQVLAPEVMPYLIQTPKQKTNTLQELGLDFVVKQKFDLDFASLSAADFFKIHIVQNLKTKALFVGHDFTFGRKREGNIDTLEQFCKDAQIELHVVKAQMLSDTLVSSTLIRKLLKEGRVEMAAKHLTRPYIMQGTVVKGHNRGTALGIHTANLRALNELLPKDGVYATKTIVADHTYHSVTNIGKNPTFENIRRSVETHIFDFDQDLYDQEIEVCFFKRIRDEIKFATPQALVKQIKKDIEQAKEILKTL